MGMETLALNIDRIETALTERGYGIRYIAQEDMTVYNIQREGHPVTVEVFDAVSGAYWRPEHTSEVLRYEGRLGWDDVTEEFGAVTSEDGLLALIDRQFTPEQQR